MLFAIQTTPLLSLKRKTQHKDPLHRHIYLNTSDQLPLPRFLTLSFPLSILQLLQFQIPPILLLHLGQLLPDSFNTNIHNIRSNSPSPEYNPLSFHNRLGFGPSPFPQLLFFGQDRPAFGVQRFVEGRVVPGAAETVGGIGGCGRGVVGYVSAWGRGFRSCVCGRGSRSSRRSA